MLSFSKYQGLGNHFILFDCRNINQNLISKLKDSVFIKSICDPNFGIGANGVILVLNSIIKCDAKMVIYNSDGSEAEMCGNGIRCLIIFLKDKDVVKIDKKLVIETLAGNINAKAISPKLVEVNMGSPILDPKRIPTLMKIGECGLPQGTVTLSGVKYKAVSVGMGNPHLIVPMDNLNDIDIALWGNELENDIRFPNKTNVHFINIRDRSNIDVVVWERGAGPTLACGTGACACLVASYKLGLSESKADIYLPGGKLKIKWDQTNNSVIMTGTAEKIFTGSIETSNTLNI
tara:strand:- start:65 stop:934 length:870 start_codon:yes stop_codon:yes gene_type:complete